MIKQDVSNGEPETRPLESFPYSSPSENTQIHAQIEHKRETGELGDFPLSAEGKNDNEGSPIPLEVPASSPTFPVPVLTKTTLKSLAILTGNLTGTLRGAQVHVPR